MIHSLRSSLSLSIFQYLLLYLCLSFSFILCFIYLVTWSILVVSCNDRTRKKENFFFSFS